MILLQVFVAAAIGLLGFLLLALYIACVDKFLDSRPYRELPALCIVIAAGGVTVLILYSGLVAQLVSWSEGMSA